MVFLQFSNQNEKPGNAVFAALPSLSRAGDERIESLRTLEIPCINAGLRDFQLAFSRSQDGIFPFLIV